jgi:DNA-binding transcriptional regulator YdaS (Cro superfamily)
MDIREAIKAKGLSQRALADLAGVTEARVSQWISGVRVPAERCLAVSAATGIPLHDLRPDIYPPPAPAREEAA